MLQLFLLEDDGSHPFTVLVAAENEETARKLALEKATWLNNNLPDCKHIGIAKEGTEQGVIRAGYMDIY